MKSDNQKYKIKSLASNVGDFTVSLHYDRRLYKQDIAGSKAHVSMLAYKNIIEKEDAETILKALDDILFGNNILKIILTLFIFISCNKKEDIAKLLICT